jgi:hypothetical protein
MEAIVSAICAPAGHELRACFLSFSRDIIARSGTIGGMRFQQSTGFVAFRAPDLWIYRRRPDANFEY